MSNITWQPVTVALSSLTPWERNPKRISKSHAKRLLDLWQRLGQFQTIAIGPGGEVYDGHQRLSVLMAAYGKLCEVTALQSSRALTEKEREELTVAAHVGTTGSFDWDALSGWDAGELQSWGFDAELLANWRTDAGALDAMLAAEEAPTGDDPGAQVDKAAELQAKWGTATGQLWQLGEHRLVCGDCTDSQVVARVMGEEKAQALVTDPPYAILGGGTSTAGKGIEASFDRQFFRAWFVALLGVLDDHLSHDAAQWMTIDWRGATAIEEAVVGKRWRLAALGVWNRGGLGMGYALRKTYENFALLVAKDWKRVKTDEPDVWSFQWTPGDRLQGHAAEKPVELMQRAIEVCSAGGIVIDPFLGSGTTLIAAQNLGRRARCIEIEPSYIAVCLERWVTMTGQTPVLVEDGKQ